MANKISILHTLAAGRRPTGMTAADVAQLFLNIPDRVIGFIDDQGVAHEFPQPYVRPHDPARAYQANELVWRDGNLWRAAGAVAPGAWNASQWHRVTLNNRGDSMDGSLTLNSGDFIVQQAGGGQPGLTFRDGPLTRWRIVRTNPSTSNADLAFARFDDAGNYLENMVRFERSTGEVIFWNDPTQELAVGNRRFNDNRYLVRVFDPAAIYPQNSLVWQGGNLWKSAANIPAGPFDPAQWHRITFDTTGDTMTGNLVLDNPSGQLRVQFQRSSLDRWVFLRDGSAEGGGNAGSDFAISRCDDAGAFIENVIAMRRVNGEVIIPHLSVEGAAGVARGLKIANQGNHNARWFIGGDATAEVNPNIGTDFQIVRYNNGGAQISIPLKIERSTGKAIFAHAVDITGIATFSARSEVKAGLLLRPATPAGFSNLILDRPTGGNPILIESWNNGLRRWGIALAGNDPETGGNTGSRFTLNRFDDAGNFVDSPIVIERSTGRIKAVNNAADPEDVLNQRSGDARYTPIVPSDTRLKRDHNPIQGALASFGCLTPTTFTWVKPKGKKLPFHLPEDRRGVGILADQVESVFPHLVHVVDGYKTVDYTSLVPYLLAAVKELSETIESLQNRLSTLESR